MRVPSAGGCIKIESGIKRYRATFPFSPLSNHCQITVKSLSSLYQNTGKALSNNDTRPPYEHLKFLITNETLKSMTVLKIDRRWHSNRAEQDGVNVNKPGEQADPAYLARAVLRVLPR